MGMTREQALDCFQSGDLVGIGMQADAVRRRLHPEGIVGYTIQGVVDCPAINDVSLGPDTCAAIEGLIDRGVSSVRLSGCGDMRHAENLLREIRKSFSALWVEAFSTGELIALANSDGVGLRDTIAKLMDAGLNTIGDNSVSLAQIDGSVIAQYFDAHRAAHELGMKTVAEFLFGAGESAEQRVDFLAAARRLQQETGGFAAFAPQAAPAPNGRELDGVTAVERLKTLAISRLFLDGIDSVRASATHDGLKVLQMGLRFGADDVGPIASDAGHEEDIRRIIRDAGFRPVERAMGYRAMMLA